MTIDVARQAITQWQHGTRSGDWSGLLGLLRPDVTFHVPVAEFPGPQRGTAAAAAFFAHISSIIRAELTVVSTLAGSGRTAFELRVRGTMHGKPFVQRLCIVFTADGDRIRTFAEYLAWPGGLDPAALGDEPDPAAVPPG